MEKWSVLDIGTERKVIQILMVTECFRHHLSCKDGRRIAVGANRSKVLPVGRLVVRPLGWKKLNMAKKSWAAGQKEH